MQKLKENKKGVTAVVGTMFMLSVMIALFVGVNLFVKDTVDYINMCREEIRNERLAFENDVGDNKLPTTLAKNPIVLDSYPPDGISGTNRYPTCIVRPYSYNNGDLNLTFFAKDPNQPDMWIKKDTKKMEYPNKTVEWDFHDASEPNTQYYWMVEIEDSNGIKIVEVNTFKTGAN